MKVRFKRLNKKAFPPQRMTGGAAGFDLTCSGTSLDDAGVLTCHTDLAFEIPPRHVGYLFPRSSIYKTGLRLTNSVGVIDSDYRGEVAFKFAECRTASAGGSRPYDTGDRIGQLIIMPIPDVEFEEVDELSDTSRGTGGFGSTGA